MDSKSIFNTLALLSKDYTNPEYFDVPQIFAALDCNGEFCLFDQNGKRLENVIIVEKKENAYEFRVGNYTGKYLIKE